eukprot:3086207-Prymnesium_polylepis.1
MHIPQLARHAVRTAGRVEAAHARRAALLTPGRRVVRRPAAVRERVAHVPLRRRRRLEGLAHPCEQLVVVYDSAAVLVERVKEGVGRVTRHRPTRQLDDGIVELAAVDRPAAVRVPRAQHRRHVDRRRLDQPPQLVLDRLVAIQVEPHAFWDARGRCWAARPPLEGCRLADAPRRREQRAEGVRAPVGACAARVLPLELGATLVAGAVSRHRLVGGSHKAEPEPLVVLTEEAIPAAAGERQ